MKAIRFCGISSEARRPSIIQIAENEMPPVRQDALGFIWDRGVWGQAPVCKSLGVTLALVLCAPSAFAQVVQTGGDGSAGNPFLLSGSGDITSYILNNNNINLSGGNYTVNIPASGAGVTAAGSGNGIVSGDGNVDPTTPVVTYDGVISGTGQVTVGNSISATQPGVYDKLSGGALKLTADQTLTNPAGAIFVVNSNTLLSINGGSLPIGAALINNGELYSNKDGYHWTNIGGNGNIYLENNDYNEAHLSGVNTISGNLISLFGEYIDSGTVLPETLSVLSTDINVIKAGGGSGNNLLGTYIPANNTIIGGNYYASGPDTQIQSSGIVQFDGQGLLIVRNSAISGTQGIYPASEAEKYDFTYNVSVQEGRVFYITDGTMLLGDGRPVTTNNDCSSVVGYCTNTNNTFAQGNPFQHNFVIQTGSFYYTPVTSIAQLTSVETLALDYSGTYTFNAGVNFVSGGTLADPVDARAYGGVLITDGSANIGPHKGDVTPAIVNGENYGNLILVTPPSGVNHVVVTVPIYQQGITQIEPNTILQLGDGTSGTPYGTKVTITTNGVTGTYDYNSSNGNGMLVTAGNAFPIYQDTAAYIIRNNGQIIVDNVPDARDLIDASQAAHDFLAQNELDNIVGTGSLLQEGTLPLTLEGTTTYSGETDIAAGSALYLKSNPATGSTGLPNSVVNLQGAGATFDISQADASNPIAGLTGVAGSTIALGSRNLTVNAAVDSTFDGVIQDGGVANGTGGSLTKTGAGTLTLNGFNTYTGLTDVQSGALAIGDLNNPGAGIEGDAQVEAGATLMGHGTIGGDLTNLGTVRPGGSIGTLAVIGNYTQGSGANLLIDVTPAASSLLNVAGRAVLDGTATFIFAPGTYTDKTYAFVAAGHGVTGRFASTVYQGSVPAAPQAPAVTYTANTALLVVGAGSAVAPIAPPTSTYPARPTPPAPTPPTPTITDPTPSAKRVRTPPDPAAFVVRPGDEQITAAQNAVLALTTDKATDTLLNRPMTGTGGAPGACGLDQADSAALGAPTGVQATTDIAKALGGALCPLGGWAQATGTLTAVDGTPMLAGFHAGTAGVLAGLDRPIGPYGTLIGLVIGDDQTWLDDDDQGRATANTVRAGLYAIQPLGTAVLNAALTEGYDFATTNRNTGIGKAYESHAGNIVSGGLQISRKTTVQGIDLTPGLGLRGSYIDEAGFAEAQTSATGFAVTGAPSRYTSVLPYVRVALSKDITLVNGGVITPSLQVSYAYQAGAFNQAVALTAQDGTTFASRFVHLDRSEPAFSTGIAYAQAAFTFFASYAFTDGSNWHAQTFMGGAHAAF